MSEYIRRCDLSKQYMRYKKDIDKAVAMVLKSGVYILGRECELFEKEFAAYVGRSCGIGVASGTDAIMLALIAMGIRQGDEVITTSYAPTPVATAIVLAGGTPVFADTEYDTCLIDPSEIKKKISAKTRFIVPVHIFGSICDMERINKIARKYGLTVIEDVAQAHGSVLGREKAGNLADIACFSFYPTKNLGGYGDGGMILTDDARVAARLKGLRNYGKRDNPFDSETLGYNSRLDEIQAAILRVKLCHLDAMNKQRRTLVDIYRRRLKGLPIRFLREHDGVKSNYHVLVVLCERDRAGLAQFLQTNSIQTNIYYPKLICGMRAFKKYVKAGEKFPSGKAASRKAIALPLYPELPARTAIFVAEKIREYYS